MRPRDLRLGLSMALVMALLPGLASQAWAQSVSMIVDRSEVTVQDQIVLQVKVEGAQAQPKLPEMPDFDVYPRGQSTQMQFINGRTSSSVIYNYILAPKNAGTFTIGAATVEIGGTTYSSRPFTIRVLPASAQPKDSGDVFLRVSVSTEKPYVGQQVVYTWQFYRRVQIAGANLEALQFPGLQVEDLGKVHDYQTVLNGQQFAVSEFRKALFPQEEGAVTIPPSALNCEIVVRDQRQSRDVFDDFFGRAQTQSRILRSKAIKLEVRPLPPAPSGFSGLVGQFGISAEVSKRKLQVGESITLNVAVKGTGNVRSIAEPALPELPSFKIYDDRPSSKVDSTGSVLTGGTTFTKALVPLKPGRLTIPALSLTYFDPGKGAYQTDHTNPLALEVTPEQGGEDLRLTESIAPTTGKVEVRILADDILPIARGLDAVNRPSRFLAAPLYLLGTLLAPPLVVFALLLGERRRRRFELDAGLGRRRAALRNARRELRHLQGEGAELARRASRLLRGYVGDKLGLEGAALTPAEVEESLTERGVDKELVAKVRSTLNRLEAAQYGAAAVEVEELKSTLGEHISALERRISGGGR